MAGLYLIAHIADRAVAIDSAQVESVVDIGAVTPVPCAPPSIRGLAALRSRVVTVVDRRVALGLPTDTVVAKRAVITVVDGHHYAVMVDTLEDVAAYEPHGLHAGVQLDAGWSGAGRAIIERDGEPILVIDMCAIIPGVTAMAA